MTNLFEMWFIYEQRLVNAVTDFALILLISSSEVLCSAGIGKQFSLQFERVGEVATLDEWQQKITEMTTDDCFDISLSGVDHNFGQTYTRGN